MGFISSFLGSIFGWLMKFIYDIVPNYGVALFIFTLITRILLIPISVNQQKTNAKMSFIQPEVNALREKHSNNSEKLNEELSKLYQKSGYNPASGCLPMLIQFVLLFGVIDVVYKPLTHILKLEESIVQSGLKLFGLLGTVISSSNMAELEFVKALTDKHVFFASLGSDAINKIQSLDYTFLGMDLMLRPTFEMITGALDGKFNPVVLIPIASGITAFLSSKVTMRSTMSSTDDNPAAQSMKNMMYIMPLMSIWIAFTVPAGVGLYWVFANLLMVVQSLFINKFFNPEKIKEKARLEHEERKKEAEKESKEKAKKMLDLSAVDDKYKDKDLSKKDVENIKLSAARKRDEDKYSAE